MWIVAGSLALVVETVACVALARWGWQLGTTTLLRWLLAGLVLVPFLVFWGTFLSPKASITIPVTAKIGLKLLVFAFSAWAASQVWGNPFAIGFFLLAAASLVATQLIPIAVESRKLSDETRTK